MSSSEGVIAERERFSNETVNQIKFEVLHQLEPQYAIVFVGSYGRGEASKQSDADYFLLYENTVPREEEKSTVRQIITRYAAAPSSNGAFDDVESYERIARNVGGPDDTNDNITRRILFLLEGSCIIGEPVMNRVRDKLLDQVYLKDQLPMQTLPMFLLNDVIRYYRTMCVDFEHKTREIANKPWGLRNIKLVFSRKLLYFSGIAMLAETYNLESQETKDTLRQLIQLTPLERVREIFGQDAGRAMDLYGEFLEKISDGGVRASLDQVRPNDESRRNNPDFRDLKDKGREFSNELVRLLSARYEEDHLIHQALIV